MAAEGRHFRSPGLQVIKSATTSANIFYGAGLEAGVLSFFSTVCQGHHATAYASNLLDFSTPFSPDPTNFPQFLDGLPSFNCA
jgi:hypothetical protein